MTSLARRVWLQVGSTIAILCIVTASFAADAEFRQPTLSLYGSLRFAFQGTNWQGLDSGPRNYRSRAGAWLGIPLPTPGGHTSFLLHAEAGSLADRVELRKRLLYAGVKSPFGQLTYGKQWTAFYATLGQYVDVGVRLSGFGYPGSTRLNDDLQYSHVFRGVHLQVDAIQDSSLGSGINRFQGGIDYRGAVWRLGMALDYSDGDGSSLRDQDLRVDSRTRPCNITGVDCYGISAGWRVRDLEVNAILSRVVSRVDHANAGAVNLQWRPGVMRYYLELGGLDGPSTSHKTIAGGFLKQWNRYLSYFGEFSVTDQGGDASDTAYILSFGVKLDFDRHF